MEDITRLSRCARCGRALPPEAGDALCATCAASVIEAPTVLGGTSAGEAPTVPGGRAAGEAPTVADTGPPASGRASGTTEAETILSRGAHRPRGAALLSPGEIFGSYRIERLLGRGGMGEVYEAEHLEHGRRVALKVLTFGFTGPEDRERFLREGEIAASINHPHAVYVYGSEEIEGAPVITMELLTGGTLREVVQQRGPLPPRDAVDRILDVIAGLEAAARAGILHRDIKPANCFVDAGGVVKVGDFGLSIATGAERAATGMFQGTPQFAPPEQLRGELLDVRADIYAVGATLFYLLTGQPPFDDPDLTTLITRVKAEVPRSAHDMRAGVPDALAAIVAQCLAKDRAARPGSYAELEDALRPMSSAAPEPAPLGRRALAGLIDHALFNFLVIPTIVFFMMRGELMTMVLGIVQAMAILLYFTIAEGLWSASIGKRLLGLRVIRPDGRRPGPGRAFVRAAIYQTSALVSIVSTVIVGPARLNAFVTEQPIFGPLFALGAFTVLALLFSPARRRNGFAAVHDRVSGTRVVLRRARAIVSTVDLGVSPGRQTLADVARVGPYDVIGSLGPTKTGELLLGRDERLKRSVWIHRQAAGTAPVPAVLHSVGRPGRLRWLTGRRTPDEAWDAYEAFDGVALAVLDRPQPWTVVRRWLHDLAVEIDAGTTDATIDSLSQDRVWVTAASGAKLLDFRAPRIPPDVPPAPEAPLADAQPWLAAMTRRAMEGAGQAAADPVLTIPPPPSATSLIDRLEQRALPSIAEVARATGELTHRLATITRTRRALTILIAGLVPVLFGAMGFLAALGLRQLAESSPEVEPLLLALQRLSAAPDGTTPPLSETERQALEVYVAGRYGPTIREPKTWTHPLTAGRIGPYRPAAEAVLTRHPAVTPEAVEAAKASLGTFLDAEAKSLRGQQARAVRSLGIAPIALALIGLALAAGGGVIFACALRGGLLLKFLGLAVVDASGRRAARWRTALRAAIAWAPAGAVAAIGLSASVFFSIANAARHPIWLGLAILSGLVFLAGAAVAMYVPNRGLQDRLAKTFVVPD